MLLQILIASCLLGFSETLRFNLGKCTLVLNEPCQTDLVKFRYISQSTSWEVNPYKPIVNQALNNFKIVLHGYGGIAVNFGTNNITEAYVNNGYNVIEVDWSPLAVTPCYVTSFVNTWHVGQCVAILAAGLSTVGIAPEDVHIIGFSLGAHIAGFASNYLQDATGFKIGRITGLDPALPFFATARKAWKLDAGDANFVDVIHTNAGAFGKIEVSGHADFFVNGGFFQPACQKAKYPVLCSHFLAGIYFTESIKSKNFIGIKCANGLYYKLGLCERSCSTLAIMGEHCDYRTRGKFYLETNQRSPFALG